MRIRLGLRKPIFRLATLFLLLPCANSSWAADAECSDVWGRGHLNVLTINLAFLEIARRDERLERIADFAQARSRAGEPIDVLLLQEGVGGALAETDSSPRDLRDKLRDRRLTYDLRTVFEAGIPGIAATSNAILSRCEIRFRLFRFLPTTSEQIQIGGPAFPVTRNVLMAQLKIPGASRRYRRVNVYNTHLCAGSSGSAVIGGVDASISGCTVEERESQLASALKFVRNVERFLSFFRDKPHVLGGDFNIDNFRGAEQAEPPVPFGDEKPLYDDIIGAGFVDAYAESQSDPLDVLCVPLEVPFQPFPDEFPSLFQDWQPDEHCTKGVSFAGFNGNFPGFFDDTPRRIDYIFEKGFRVGTGEVVFNPNASPPEPFEPVVSDHSGVLVRLLFK